MHNQSDDAAKPQEMNMQSSQISMLTIRDLFAMSGGVVCGADAEIAIMDGDNEIERLTFSGKVGPDREGYRRSYIGKPGLNAKVASGPGSITMTSNLG